MSYENPGKTISLIAAADYNENRYAAVKLGAADEQFTIAGADEKVVGVLQQGTGKDQVGCVMISGVTFMVASAAIGAGKEVISAVGGKAAPAIEGSVNVLGSALNAASAAGDIISVLLKG